MKMNEFLYVENALSSLYNSTYINLSMSSIAAELDRQHSQYVTHQKIMFRHGHGTIGLLAVSNNRYNLIVLPQYLNCDNERKNWKITTGNHVACVENFPIMLKEIIPPQLRRFIDYPDFWSFYEPTLCQVAFVDRFTGYELYEDDGNTYRRPTFDTKLTLTMLWEKTGSHKLNIEQGRLLDPDEKPEQEFQAV